MLSEQEELIKTKEDFLSLLANPGWKRLTNMALDQVDTRRQKIELKPCDGIAAILNQEYMKGEIGALLLFVEIPTIQLEEAEAVLKAAAKQEEQKDVS